MRSTSALATSALIAGATAQYLGFNSGALKGDDSAKFKADFVDEFKAAQGLQGAPGTFNAVRLYTNIQAYSDSDPIEAFEAAVETKTKILLGIWTSGVTSIDKELKALTTAVDKLGSDFTDLVVGISIGSEDLYRISVTGLQNDPTGVGNSPTNLVNFISDFKKAVADTGLAKIPIGHVDTWDVWGNSSNKAVLDAVDWVGVDEYPYYEGGKGNTIENAPTLFDKAYDAVKNTVGDKDIWVTETGWPVTGPDWDQAKPSAENAKFYWDEIGCRVLFNKVNTFWYTLIDSNSADKAQFAVSPNMSTTPYYNLTCPTTFVTGSSPTSNSTSNGTSSSSTTTSSPTSSSTSSSGGASTTSSAPSSSTSPSAAGMVNALSTFTYAVLGLVIGGYALL